MSQVASGQLTIDREFALMPRGGGVAPVPSGGWRWWAYCGSQHREGWTADRLDALNASHAAEMALAGAPGWAERERSLAAARGEA